MSTADPCPICGGIGCRTYPLMVERYLAGRDRDHWRLIHDRMNGLTPDDRALREHVARHGCGAC